MAVSLVPDLIEAESCTIDAASLRMPRPTIHGDVSALPTICSATMCQAGRERIVADTGHESKRRKKKKVEEKTGKTNFVLNKWFLQVKPKDLAWDQEGNREPRNKEGNFER